MKIFENIFYIERKINIFIRFIIIITQQKSLKDKIMLLGLYNWSRLEENTFFRIKIYT
jgi:hypothetical protein